MCKACSLRITNGRWHNDKNVGEFTYHNKNGSSVLLNRLSNFERK